MNNSFSSLTEKHQSILVLLPKNPTIDEVSGGLSLFLSLRENKDITISCPTAMTVAFNRLVGVNKITTELGSKNLTVRLEEYNPENIEKVSAEVIGDTFTLIVIPKTNNEPPTKNQVNLGYSGVKATLVILIGGKGGEDFPALGSEELGDNVEIAHLGISDISLEKRQVASFAKPASSVSEIVGELVMPAEGKISEDIASNLITGISEGSRNFTVENVSANTFEIAASLMKAGGRRIDTAPPAMQRQYPAGSIPGEKIEKPQGETTNPNPPQSWMQQPKIYKGTSVS